MNSKAVEELQQLFDKVTIDLMRKIQELKDDNRALRERLNLTSHPQGCRQPIPSVDMPGTETSDESPVAPVVKQATKGGADVFDPKDTIRYRLGDALISTFYHPTSIVSLPIQLGRLLREGYQKHRSRMQKLKGI